MPSDDRRVALTIRDDLALAELAEFAARAPHLDFGLARRRAIADALLRQPSTPLAYRLVPASGALDQQVPAGKSPR